MLTFIDGEPLKAGLLLRGSTVFPFHENNTYIYIQWNPAITAPLLKVPHQ